MTVKDVWGGAAGGLLGEVVEQDCYLLRKLDFKPDVFFDFGGNIGITARFARELFPQCLVVSVEPDKSNIQYFKQFTNDDKIILIEKAIGMGEVWRTDGATNGSGENYITDSIGYPREQVLEDARMKSTTIPSIMPDDIINEYLKQGMKSVLKLDIEAGENVIWHHKPSMDAMKKIDYLCFEVHKFGLNGRTWGAVQYDTEAALHSFTDTHDCHRDGVHFYATKKQI